MTRTPPTLPYLDIRYAAGTTRLSRSVDSRGGARVRWSDVVYVVLGRYVGRVGETCVLAAGVIAQTASVSYRPTAPSGDCWSIRSMSVCDLTNDNVKL